MSMSDKDIDARAEKILSKLMEVMTAVDPKIPGQLEALDKFLSKLTVEQKLCWTSLVRESYIHQVTGDKDDKVLAGTFQALNNAIVETVVALQETQAKLDEALTRLSTADAAEVLKMYIAEGSKDNG